MRIEKDEGKVIFYPYISSEYGDKSFGSFLCKNGWELLKEVEVMYEQKGRLLRRIYKWTPETIYGMPLDMFVRIVDETIEDYSDENGKLREPGFI